MFEFADKEEVNVFSEQDCWVIRNSVISAKDSAIFARETVVNNRDYEGYTFDDANFNNQIKQYDEIIAKCDSVIQKEVDKRFAENNG
jgi:hypothetical protein